MYTDKSAHPIWAQVGICSSQTPEEKEKSMDSSGLESYTVNLLTISI